MNEPQYRLEYDYTFKRWKNLLWRPDLQQWVFYQWLAEDAHQDKRDSHHSQTPTPTPEYTPEAGPSYTQPNQTQYGYSQHTNYDASSYQQVYAQQPHVQAPYSQPAQAQQASGQWHTVTGSYNSQNPAPHSNYERLDPTFFVREGSFFQEGRLFAVLFTEPAGENAIRQLNRITDYNDSLSRVSYGEVVFTQVRRFIVVQCAKEFCYAVPIFTYKGKGTTKPGVAPEQHAIAYSYGFQPQLVPGERQLTKDPICLVMTDPAKPLAVASRIYFGIHHPIQYNVKVKDMGYVHPDYMPAFKGYFHMENNNRTQQAPETATETEKTAGSAERGKQRRK